jgi:hypothetical protein
MVNGGNDPEVSTVMAFSYLALRDRDERKEPRNGGTIKLGD